MKDGKSTRLIVYVSPDDKEKITKAAKRCGLPASEYVFQCCKNHTPKEKPPDEFWDLLSELYSVYEGLSPEKQDKLAQLILRLQEVV